MDINLNWKGGLLLAIFLYLNSTLAQAQPILVGAEYGGQVPIEGVWEFPGCFQDEEYGEYDYKEYLIFTGDQVEGRVVQYTSTDESCSGVETIIESDTGTVFPGGLQTEGTCWDDEPPQRQDSTGPLAANPAASWLIFWLGEGEAEAGLYYIDDTAETWYLWRGAGGDENGNGDNGNGEENGGGPYEPEEPPCPFPLKAEEPLMKLTPATITVTVDIK
ncbi:MAG: hypothetical protein PVI70_15735, partial [Gammaproteobacteria bacterium]